METTFRTTFSGISPELKLKVTRKAKQFAVPLAIGAAAACAYIAFPKVRTGVPSRLRSKLNSWRHSVFLGEAEPVGERSPYDIDLPPAP